MSEDLRINRLSAVSLRLIYETGGTPQTPEVVSREFRAVYTGPPEKAELA